MPSASPATTASTPDPIPAAGGIAAPGPPPARRSGPTYGARYDEGRPAPATGPVTRDVGLLTYRPGVITLRPSSLAELIDAAVTTIRSRPGLFIGVGALVVVLGTLARAAVDALVGVTLVMPDGSMMLRITPSLALLPVLAELLACLLAAPTAQAVLGRRPTAGTTAAALRPRAGAVLVYTAAVLLVCGALAGLTWSGLGGRSAQQLDLFLALLGVGVLLDVVRLPFLAAPAALVLEGVSPVRALGRARRLIRGKVGRTIAVAVLARLLVILVSLALSLPAVAAVLVLKQTTGLDLPGSVLGPALTTLFTMLTACLTLPYEAVLRALFYVDLRVRAEGLDVALVDAARREAAR